MTGERPVWQERPPRPEDGQEESGAGLSIQSHPSSMTLLSPCTAQKRVLQVKRLLLGDPRAYTQPVLIPVPFHRSQPAALGSQQLPCHHRWDRGIRCLPDADPAHLSRPLPDPTQRSVSPGMVGLGVRVTMVCCAVSSPLRAHSSQARPRSGFRWGQYPLPVISYAVSFPSP